MTDTADFGGACPGFGWMHFQQEMGYAWVHGVAPAACPGCGAASPFHPWGCPVLVRLCAQLLAREDAGWRGRAAAMARAAGRPFAPEAVHWRAVAAVDNIDPGVLEPAAWTPYLVPADGGLCETATPDGCNLPGAAAVLARLRAAGAGRPGGLLAGATVLPFLFTPPEFPDEGGPPLDDPDRPVPRDRVR